MATSDRKARPIRAHKASEFSRWRMPEMTRAEREKLIALAQAKTSSSSNPVEIVEEPLHSEKLTVAEWEALREDARKEGQALGYTEGLEQGRKEGVEQGLAEGLLQAETQVQEKLAQIQSLIETLQAPLKQQEQAIHELLLKLCLRISRGLVEAEYAARSDLILETIDQALQKVPPGSGAPVISLHPLDLELVQPLADLNGWELRENPNASRGDLQLVAGSCMISSELEQQMLEVAGTLLQRASGDLSDDAD